MLSLRYLMLILFFHALLVLFLEVFSVLSKNCVAIEQIKVTLYDFLWFECLIQRL